MIIEENVKFTLILADDTRYNVSSAEIQSISLSSQAVSGNSFELGSVYSAQLSTSFYIEHINSYNIIGAKIILYIFKNDEWKQSGIFNVTSASRYRDIISVSASDNMILLDSSAFVVGAENSKINEISSFFIEEKSIYQILRYAISLSGLHLGNSQEEIENMPNGTITAELVTESNQNANIRDWVSWCAEILGGFAIADEFGNIKIRQFEMDSTAVFNSGMISADTSEVADFTANNFDVSITTYDEIWYKTYTITDETETMINIEFQDNPIAQGHYYIVCQRYSDEHAEGEDSPRTLKMFEFTEAIWNAIGNLPIRPCNLAVASDELLHVGQRITVPDADGNLVDTLIMSLSWSPDTLQKIRCIGEDTRLISLVRQRSSEKRIAEALKTEIDESRGRIITQAEFDALAAENKLIEGKEYNIVG